jgi:hypothetical protein
VIPAASQSAPPRAMAARAIKSVLTKNTPHNSSDRPETYATASDISGCMANKTAPPKAIQSSIDRGSPEPPMRTRASAQARRKNKKRSTTSVACKSTLVRW